MARNHANPFAIQPSRRNVGGGLGGHYEAVDQDFEAQDVLRGANNNPNATNKSAKSNRSSRNNYQRDQHSDEDEVDSNDYNSSDDDNEDYASLQRRRRKYMNTNIGDLYRNNSSRNNNDNSSSLSFNLILFCLIAFIAVFGLGYYGLSKREQRQNHAKELHEQEEVERLKEKYGLVELDKNEEDIVQQTNQVESVPAVGNADVQSNQNQNAVSTSSKPAKSHHPENFDPFHLHKQQQQINSHTNDWFGAPFVVSPPQIPSFIDNGVENANGKSSSGFSGSRLGYFQYPTIVNSTLVFSSEGDLYLTRVPTTTNNTDSATSSTSMPAMKLTTTVGNAIHPKLNPKYPHLLAYSATYSGVREVYLMDLRGITNDGGMSIRGVPGSPGGPALRLTYTTGGINSVVGWDEDGTSILYSAWGDQVGMWDVRLYRLRLSSSGGIAREDVTKQNINGGDEAPPSKGGEGDTGGKDFSIEDAKSYVDQVIPPNDTEHTLDDGDKPNNTSSADAINKTETTSHDKKKHKKTKDTNANDDKQRKFSTRAGTTASTCSKITVISITTWSCWIDHSSHH